MHWFPQNRRRKFPFWTMPHHHFYVCVPPNNYKTKKSSGVTNKHLERTSKSTPTPSTLVPANIRTFSIPSDDWQDVQRPKSAPAKLFVFIAWIVEARRPRSGCRSNTRPAPIDPPTIQLQSTQRASSDSIVRISAAYLFGRRQNRPPKINISDMAFWWKCCLLQGSHSHRWWWRMGEHTQMQAATFRITCNQLRPTMTINHPSKH